ncbi:SMC-Scp complex subunit ScpB [Chengkuizengella marina]|uniref:Segregation and condensation protein B n=1 Tax=Chengkuizengella marina TaxID=2507566 RepID=A0A6N9Q6W8_9BACL|nr:SMC-Scp complex subunit ScpB [Chengkuizengella marina]NBI30423.1 SMC-Scp complex subunit ScpB [Chengkuizengella marina]
MNSTQMKSIIEGLIFVSGDEGIDVKQIAKVLEQDEKVIIDVLKNMKQDYEKKKRGIQILELAGSFQFTTRPEHSPYFQRLAQSPSRATLSQAALETLAIIAYKQPITRVEIEDIRGVKSDRAIHTLVVKGLAHGVGRAESLGRPILYGTTKQFLDYFGINSLKDLPDQDTFENHDNLEEETKKLLEKMGMQQMTMNDLE